VVRQQSHDAVVAVLARLNQHRASFVLRSSREEYEWALRQAVVALQAYSIVNARLDSLGAAGSVRDAAFAENIMWILERLPSNACIIIFAHNLHVAKEPFHAALTERSSRPVTSLGEYLAEWLAADYVAVGTTVGTGGLRGGGPGLVTAGRGPESEPAAAAEDGLDGALEQLGIELLLLSLAELRTSSSVDSWIGQPQIVRSHRDPQPEYRVGHAFDAVAYVDRITSAVPLR